MAARFAAALEVADAAALAAVSEEFEELGDRIAAVDAAAHATIVYRRAGLRGSALGCAARAETGATSRDDLASLLGPHRRKDGG